jgi:Ca2+/Na+ antiporter
MLQPLLSKQWKEMIDESRIIQHIIGLTTIIALIILLSDGHVGSVDILSYSLIAYVWFLLSTKLDIHWNIIVIVLLLVAYLYENSLKFKEINTSNDKILTEEEKKYLQKDNCYKRMYFMIGILMVTITGVLIYANKKEEQYGGGYSTLNFLLY